MIVTLVPERICYVEEIHRWILNVGPYHLWFDTKQEAEDYWIMHSEDFGLKGV